MIVLQLMANLFSESLSAIKLGDVEQFLNLEGPEGSRPIEGPRLDFKRDLPQNIGSHVAALANTYGGVLLVGVQTDKARRNIPVSLPGADLGHDPRARISDMIVATVHPRPAFEIQPMNAADKVKSVAVIGVQEGTFPPYEYAQGATVSIPVRIGDSSRQATLREIEALLKKRELAGRDAQQLVQQYLSSSGFFCSVEGVEQATKQLYPDPQFHKILMVPRAPMKLRLDLRAEKDLGSLIHTVYRLEQNFCRAREGVPYSEDFCRGRNFVQYEFRISGKAPCHRVWRVWEDGTLGFVTNHSRIQIPEPAGNLALELLLFLRLARKLLAGRSYYGASALSYTLACPSHKFSPEFPVADLDLVGRYDGVDGLFFDTPSHFQTGQATVVEDVDWDTLGGPEELVASLLLDQLRAIAGARIDHHKLLAHVKHLSLRFFGPAA